MNTEHGCLDVDECQQEAPCDKNKFCVNTDGAHKCHSCDKGCSGCDGDGPDNCVECAEGYQRGKNDVYITATEYYLANNTMNGDLQPTPGTLDAIQAQFAQGMPGMGDMGDIPPPEDMIRGQ